MAVTILTKEQKQKVVELVTQNDVPKSKVANLYGVSSRTIYRVLEEMSQPELLVEDEVAEVAEDAPISVPVEEVFTYTVVANNRAISISRTSDKGSVDTVNIDSTHKNFSTCLDMLKSKGFDDSNLAEVYALADTKTFIERFSKGRITVDPVANQVSYKTQSGNDRYFSGRLVDRLIGAVKSGEHTKVTGLVNFAEKLSKNPSKGVVDELYDFLEASDIEINAEGDVICWKKVRTNFTDIHSGKFDNSPGTSPRVERNEVDENSRNLCSNGLHVCSRAYLPFFGGRDAVVVKVSVDPADFVSIPDEYFSSDSRFNVKAKARVCGYSVLEQVDI